MSDGRARPRIDGASLQRMRAERSGRILVTGATGFLGSHFAVALLRAGYRVAVLARAARGLNGRERIHRLVRWFGLDKGTAARLEIVEGDILDAAPAGRRDGPGFQEIVHCASSTAFAERKRAEVEAANIGGLERVLDLAVRDGCAFFHLVSTAYAAGQRTGRCPEDWVASGPFTNVYEETKARGEILARDVCRREGLRLNVYRPTIVYGDSRTGRTLRFNALYYPVKAAVTLGDIYRVDIRERGGRRAEAMGIRETDDGRLFMPLRIEVGGGGLDLIPVDHCVAAFRALFEDGLDGGIYHIASGRATRVEDLVAYTRRFFRLDGIETCGPEAFAGRPRNALEKLYETYLEAYRPYIQDARTFDDANAAPILRQHGLTCPGLDDAAFARCMEFAVATDWGAKLFGP